MKLVDNWRECWKWHSTWAIAILAAIPSMWAELPPDIKAMVPDSWGPFIAVAFAAIGILMRLLAQGPTKPEDMT